MDSDEHRSRRDLEAGIERDFTRKMSYGDYLRLDRLLSAVLDNQTNAVSINDVDVERILDRVSQLSEGKLLQ